MSQLFQKDAQSSVTALPVVNANETTIITTNAITPPFGTAKAVVRAEVAIALGATTTAVVLKLRRNPAGENVVVATVTLAIVNALGTINSYFLSAIDSIPDGRSVAYSLTLTQTGGSGNGNTASQFIEATLISG